MVVASKASRHAEMRAKPMTVAYPERRLTPRVGGAFNGAYSDAV
jgi:hypothetical protein